MWPQWLPRPPRWVGVAYRDLRRRGGRAPDAPRTDEGRDDTSEWWRLLEGFDAVPDEIPGIGVIVAAVAVAVYARSDLSRATWAVIGWRASGRAVHFVAERIARGDDLDAIHPSLL